MGGLHTEVFAAMSVKEKNAILSCFELHNFQITIAIILIKTIIIPRLIYNWINIKKSEIEEVSIIFQKAIKIILKLLGHRILA